LCPNCSWRAEGWEIEILQREKHTHAMFECPLPSKAPRSPQTLAS
jgi:hypothetical protein